MDWRLNCEVDDNEFRKQTKISCQIIFMKELNTLLNDGVFFLSVVSHNQQVGDTSPIASYSCKKHDYPSLPRVNISRTTKKNKTPEEYISLCFT